MQFSGLMLLDYVILGTSVRFAVRRHNTFVLLCSVLKHALLPCVCELSNADISLYESFGYFIHYIHGVRVVQIHDFKSKSLELKSRFCQFMQTP